LGIELESPEPDDGFWGRSLLHRAHHAPELLGNPRRRYGLTRCVIKSLAREEVKI
jgi:hypothetical protein